MKILRAHSETLPVAVWSDPWVRKVGASHKDWMDRSRHVDRPKRFRASIIAVWSREPNACFRNVARFSS